MYFWGSMFINGRLPGYVQVLDTLAKGMPDLGPSCPSIHPSLRTHAVPLPLGMMIFAYGLEFLIYNYCRDYECE